MCRNYLQGGAFHSALVAGNDTIRSGIPTSRMPVAGIQGVEIIPLVPGRSHEFLTVCLVHETARVTCDLGAELP
jgi:hypothetical protein